ncbi:hypothetical protein HYH02_013690 [Chlamydomonas schloesseri]|uniref:Calcineurin-like phosphoesterase domain-containing protein n=1 Tax=Chlamydomonas schloesseri TaxID=2026947 RepID=A0A835VYM6_9CHLO|nr:hypothetical protein HYH02_013690 [Chlamydomonas schloesseri]|eukprot:KAG2430693.1 hypothetical protein HYH02_013690 [Chlamydomonas schloesseri]
MGSIGSGSQHTALRADYDLEDEDRFFISGVEKAGAKRNTYEVALKRRKLLVGLGIGIGVVGLVALILGLAYGLSRRKLDYVCPRTYEPGKTDLVFFVVGDWGRAGNDNQRRTARLMADVASCMPPAFIISTGDNFYPSGIRSVDDVQFDTSFRNVYTAQGLQVPWYVVMGNHDYGDAVDVSQLSSGQCLAAPTSAEQCAGKCCYSPWWQTQPGFQARDTRWNASMGGVVTRAITLPPDSATGAARRLDLIMVDTTPIIYQYAGASWAGFLNGFNAQDGDAIKEAIQQHLNASYANGSAAAAGGSGGGGGGGGSSWRLVVGHHPVRSYGRHCMQPDAYDCDDMMFLRPWLKKYRVAAYINGHEHDQQLIKSSDDPVHYITSGAGSDTRKGEFDGLDMDTRTRDALFLSDTQGFVAVVLSGSQMKVHFYTTEQSGPTYTRVIPQPSW